MYILNILISGLFRCAKVIYLFCSGRGNCVLSWGGTIKLSLRCSLKRLAPCYLELIEHTNDLVLHLNIKFGGKGIKFLLLC